MKIAVYAPQNEFTDALQTRLTEKLPKDSLVAWKPGQQAPDKDVEVLIGMGRLTREQMEEVPSLELIQTASDGFEAVDVKAATELGIWVSYSPATQSGNGDSVAEYAVLLLLAASRHLGEARRFVYDPSVKRPVLNPALIGKTVCIVGLGSIGSKIAERLRPFGVHLSAVDEHPEHAPKNIPTRPVAGLKEALAEVDYVVLAVRASKENEHMIDAGMLASMKRGAILVNIARGSLIDEGALLDAVRSGQIAAAGLDVVEHEPVDPKNPLLQLPQVFITPHIAGFTDHTLEGTAAYIAEVLDRFRNGKRIESILNAPKNPRRPLEGPASKPQG